MASYLLLGRYLNLMLMRVRLKNGATRACLKATTALKVGAAMMTRIRQEASEGNGMKSFEGTKRSLAQPHVGARLRLEAQPHFHFLH